LGKLFFVVADVGKGEDAAGGIDCGLKRGIIGSSVLLRLG
jgi:hypothetical protein